MTRYARTLLTAVVVGLTLFDAGRSIVRAQTTQTFRTRVDLVQLDVLVLDQQRRPVTGLTAQDFTVLEDGKSVAVEAFAAITLPSPVVTTGAAWTREIAPDVVSNQRAEDGRLVVIVMDRSIPVGEPTLVARRIAHATIDAMGPTDVAAIVRTSGFAGEGVQQNFTSDRRILKAAIEAPFMGFTKPPDDIGGATPPSGECLCGLCVLESIGRVADAMSLERRRHKSLIFVGSEIGIEGRPGLSGATGIDCRTMLLIEREKTLRAIDRGNVTFHSLDPSALATIGYQAETGGPMAPATLHLSRQNNLLRQSDLASLPEYTGGRTVLNTNDPQSQVSQIFAESQSYYLLGFARSPGGRADRRRNIRIRVNRDDVIVRSRAGYYAPEPGISTTASDSSAGTIAGLLPRTDLPLELAVTPVFQPDGTTAVDLVIGFSMEPRAAESAAATPVDVFVGVFDERARPMTAARQRVDVPLDASRFEWRSFFPSKPGRYEVRVGVVDRGHEGSPSGSVYAYVEVPSPEPDGLMLSGVRLAQQRPSQPGKVDEDLLLPRMFSASDRVTARVQVYRGRERVGVVHLHARIVDVADRVVIESIRTLESSSFTAGGVADVTLEVPLSTLREGRYLLTVEAQQDVRRIRRAVPFAIGTNDSRAVR